VKHKTKVFDVAKYKLTIPSEGGDGEVALTSFTLRELDGEDELAALERACVAAPADRMPTGSLVIDHQVAESFIAVNGNSVQSPYLAWRKWPAKSRDFVRAAWGKMNDAPRKDVDDFLAAAFGD